MISFLWKCYRTRANLRCGRRYVCFPVLSCWIVFSGKCYRHQFSYCKGNRVSLSAVSYTENISLPFYLMVEVNYFTFQGFFSQRVFWILVTMSFVNVMKLWHELLKVQKFIFLIIVLVFFSHYCCCLEVSAYSLFNLPSLSQRCPAVPLSLPVPLVLSLLSLTSCVFLLIFLFVTAVCLLLSLTLTLLPILLWLLSSCPLVDLLPPSRHTSHYCKQGFTSSTGRRVRGQLEVWAAAVRTANDCTHKHTHTCQEIY